MNPEHHHSEENGSSTEELLRSVRRGDLGSWSILDRRYRARLTRLLHGQIPSDIRARLSTGDVVQSALFAAYRNIDQFDQQSEDGFRLWIKQILRNRLRTRIRFHRAQRRDAAAEIGPLVEKLSAASLQEDSDHVTDGIAQALEGLSRLPVRDQDFLRLRFFDQASFSQIGEAMGVSESSARRKISSLLVRLRSTV